MRYWSVAHDPETISGLALGSADDAARLEEQLAAQAWVRDWEPVTLELVEGRFADYLATNLPIRLCSLRLSGLVNSYRALGDRFQWLPVNVIVDGEPIPFAALHILNGPMWLDVGHSRWQEEKLIHPVVNRELAAGRRVLGIRDDLRSWFIEEELCEAMEDARMSGCAYYEIDVV